VDGEQKQRRAERAQKRGAIRGEERAHDPAQRGQHPRQRWSRQHGLEIADDRRGVGEVGRNRGTHGAPQPPAGGENQRD
jgi:hypothetical protein